MNIETDGLSTAERTSILTTAVQLGFSGVVLNHVVNKGARHGCCRTRALDLYSMLGPDSHLAGSAHFHRQVLQGSWGGEKEEEEEEEEEEVREDRGGGRDETPAGEGGGAAAAARGRGRKAVAAAVPPRLPFRQYDRLTLVVETAIQASVFNASNPAISSYDLVSIHPTSQRAFDQACTNLEVDIISLDLCHRVPFHLKASSVKAAVERGIFFEISFSGLLLDLKARREIFANAQMLQKVTRGHNIIVSSGARRSVDLRGPYDIANMATLFGLSKDAAKASVSRNCEDAILRGLARKRIYKSAIVVDKYPGSVNAAVPDESLFDVPEVWDPFSSTGLEGFVSFWNKATSPEEPKDDVFEKELVDGSEVLNHQNIEKSQALSESNAFEEEVLYTNTDVRVREAQISSGRRNKTMKKPNSKNEVPYILTDDVSEVQISSGGRNNKRKKSSSKEQATKLREPKKRKKH